MGYGKSHILAAFTCMLYRQGKRVVFLSLTAVLRNPVLYIRSALLCAFAGGWQILNATLSVDAAI